MTRDKDFQPFEIELQPGYLSVSNFSSLLRVFQVTMREVSRNVDGLSTIISDHQNPVLRVEADQTGRLLTLKFCFFDGERSTYLSALSHQAFQLFFDEFGEYIKTNIAPTESAVSPVTTLISAQLTSPPQLTVETDTVISFCRQAQEHEQSSKVAAAL